MTNTRTILAALTTTTLLAIGAPANATDGYAAPTAEHVTSVEGRWSVGFRTYNDDGTTVAQKATVSDNGTTFERAELVTGP